MNLARWLIALVLLVLAHEATGGLVVPTIIGLAVLVTCIVLFSLVLRREQLAERVARAAAHRLPSDQAVLAQDLVQLLAIAAEPRQLEPQRRRLLPPQRLGARQRCDRACRRARDQRGARAPAGGRRSGLPGAGLRPAPRVATDPPPA